MSACKAFILGKSSWPVFRFF